MPEPVPPQTGQDSEADSPLELSGGDWKSAVKRAAKEFKSDRGTLISAGMAYYWFLAIFPALLAAVGVIGLLNLGQGTVKSITDAIEKTLPGGRGGAGGALVASVRQASTTPKGASVVAVLIGLALALWSASSGMVALQSGLNVAYDIDEDRKFVGQRAVAFVLLVVAAVLAGVATASIVFGKPIGDAIRDNIPLGGAFVPVWTIGRWLVAVVAVSILFAAFYYIAPNRDSPRWTWVSPGGLLGTAIWLLASLAFSFYVSSFGNYGKTYGPLAGVVVLLLWLYLSALAVVFGGELNAELERSSAERAGEVAPPPAPTARQRTDGETRRPAPAARQAAPRPTRETARSQPTRETAPPQAAREPAPEDDRLSGWEERMRQLRD